MTPPHPYADDSFPDQPEVLLVDDDEVNLLLTALALRERGFKMVEACSGEAALELLRDWTPEETALARSAARMLGLLIGATLA